MKGIINNIINLYEMQAKTLGVLVTNTQKALNEFEKNKKAVEQAKRVESFVKDLIMDLNNRMTKFYWLKEHKQKWQEKMTSDQVNAIVDFAHWVKSLTPKVLPILEHFQKSPTFEEKIERDMQELEAYIKAKLKKFDQALEGTQDSLSNHLNKYAIRLASNIPRFFQSRCFGITKRANMELLKEQTQGTREDSSTQTDNCSDDPLEVTLRGLNVNSMQKNERLNHQVYSKV